MEEYLGLDTSEYFIDRMWKPWIINNGKANFTKIKTIILQGIWLRLKYDTKIGEIITKCLILTRDIYNV